MEDLPNQDDEFSKRLDESLSWLRPEPGLEERIVRKLPSRHPWLYRAAVGVAATIVVGAVGTHFLLPTLNRARAVQSFAETNRMTSELYKDDQMQTPSDGRKTPDSEDRVKEMLNESETTRALKEAQAPPVVAFTSTAGLANGVTPLSVSEGAGSAIGQEVALATKDNPETPATPPPGNSSLAGALNAPAALAKADTFEALLPGQAQPAATPNAPALAVETDRKIIRSGQINFEVDSFDAAYTRLTKIVHDCGGYVGSTDSQRLPNGKMQGDVTVRLPPANLDALVLKLRDLGEIKQEQITAEDITRQYTDLQSELTAAQAMQDRLLDLIRHSDGQVKDLLAVERELGVWREKIEKVTGEINYDNNQVALSTLQVSLTEKDIGQTAVATQTESINAGLETEDVAHARDVCVKAVEEAKGQVIQSELNQLEGGQFVATISASVPPDTASTVVDRLRALGRLVRYVSTRQESVADQNTISPNMRIERINTSLYFSIYAVGQIPAQETDELTLMARSGDLRAAYQSLLDFSAKPENQARVIDKDLEQSNGMYTTASIDMEISRALLAAMEQDESAIGQVINRKVTRQPDSANVVDTKVLLKFSLVNPLNVSPRKTVTISVQAPSPTDAVRQVTGKLGDDAVILERSTDSEPDGAASARLVVNVPLSEADGIEHLVAGAGDVQQDQSSEDSQAPTGPAARARVEIQFNSPPALIESDGGAWGMAKQGLAVAVRALIWSLEGLLVGTLIVAPWLPVGWLITRWWNRRRAS